MVSTFISEMAPPNVVVAASGVCVTNLTPATFDLNLDWYFFTYYDENKPAPASSHTGKTANDATTCVDLGTWIEPQYLSQNYEMLVQTIDPVDKNLVYDSFVPGYLKYAKGGPTVTYLCGDDTGKTNLCCCIEGEANACSWDANAVCQMPAFFQ